jgi:hypothetical protein
MSERYILDSKGITKTDFLFVIIGSLASPVVVLCATLIIVLAYANKQSINFFIGFGLVHALQVKLTYSKNEAASVNTVFKQLQVNY